MSNRSLIEINHDYCPDDKSLEEWAQLIRVYLRTGDKEFLPRGVKLKHVRHHTSPDPAVVGSLPCSEHRWRSIFVGSEEKGGWHHEVFWCEVCGCAEVCTARRGGDEDKKVYMPSFQR